jgi:alpha-tubulin suppressor-like RCC1 family protein
VGSNIGGVLGIGSASPTASSTFLAVAGSLKWKQLASTNAAACGITSDGALYCWGNVANYNSGANAVSSSNAPVLITNAVAFTSLTQRIGTNAVCGLTATGAAYCVGANIAQFGAATGSSSQTPERVGGTNTFKSLSYNSDNLCGVTTSGALMCWGSNGNGQLGQGASGPVSSTAPLTVMSGTSFSAVDLSDEGSVCAIATDSKGYCWGYNFHGQIGDGTKVNKGAPTTISGGIVFRVP